MTTATQARIEARIAQADAEARVEKAIIARNAARTIATATRARWGLTMGDYNCYDARDTSGRWAAVKAVDEAYEDATDELAAAREALAEARANAKLADRIAVATNKASLEGEIVGAFAKVARLWARLG